MNHIVVGMGEALWDVLPEGKKIGGAPANFAYHVSQFGLESRVVSAVGEDKLGMEILENFRAKKLNCMIETVPYPTGTVQVELDAEGVPCYDIKEGVAWDNIPFTPALEGGATQRGVARNNQPFPRHDARRRRTVQDIRHQPASGVLHKRHPLQLNAEVQHLKD